MADLKMLNSDRCCGIQMLRQDRTQLNGETISVFKCPECGSRGGLFKSGDGYDREISERDKLCLKCKLPDCVESHPGCAYHNYKI